MEKIRLSYKIGIIIIRLKVLGVLYEFLGGLEKNLVSLRILGVNLL